MRKWIAAAVISAALLGSACTTSYTSLDESLTGGYTETQLTPTSWRVTVQGNGLSSRRDIEAFLLRRCAELTLEQGRRYFILDDHRAWVASHPVSRHDIVSSPVNSAVVIAVDREERDAFDAVRVVETTNEAAQNRLSIAAQKTLEALKGRAS